MRLIEASRGQRRGVSDHAFGCSCQKHAARPWNRSEHWSRAEVEYLESHFGRSSDAAIAVKLGRSIVGLRLKAKRLEMRKRDAGLSATEVGRLLGVDATTVTKVWIRKGLLKTRRGFVQGPHRVHLATYEAVEQFIRDYGQWLDAEGVPEDSPFKAPAMANRWVSLSELVVITGHGKAWLLWYLRSGLMETRRKATHWYVRAEDVWKLPTRAPDALEDARFRRDEMLRRRRDRRKGIAA